MLECVVHYQALRLRRYFYSCITGVWSDTFRFSIFVLQAGMAGEQCHCSLYMGQLNNRSSGAFFIGGKGDARHTLKSVNSEIGNLPIHTERKCIGPRSLQTFECTVYTLIFFSIRKSHHAHFFAHTRVVLDS